MSLTHELSMVPRFGLEVSPALISFAEMLMLPYSAMQSMIEEELCSNAALERLDAGECPICRGAWPTRCPACSVPASGAGRSAKEYLGVSTDLEGAESASQALFRAVRMETKATDTAIVEYVVDSLDGHGLLDRSCPQLAADLGVEESVIAYVVDVIRRTGPPGVGATSVEECLLFQLDAVSIDTDLAALARLVITAHLPALAKGHFASIAHALGVTSDEIKQVLDLIRRRLRPYPAFEGNATTATCYIVPDVVVRHHDEIDGEFTIDLVEPALTRLGIRPAARRGHGLGATGVAGASLPRARSFLSQLHDRWETLRRVSECVIERQKAFLIDGAVALHPLTRAEVASELDLHESTVSRTVADKYVLLPDRALVPLARFFGISGGVDGELRKLLGSAVGPVSDQRLADQLREAGYPIARRTVAKHRARLGITASALR